jgi:hypothetical protein
MIGYKMPLGREMIGYKMPLGKNRIGNKMPLMTNPIVKKIADAVVKKTAGLEKIRK